MPTVGEGHASAHPFEQGRLGQEVEDTLAALASRALSVGRGTDADERRRALQIVKDAAAELSDLADRAEEVGRLCSAVEKELMLAESLIAGLSARALMWTAGDGERPFPEAGAAGETGLPRMSRSEYVESMRRLAISIRQAFPGDTAMRWMALGWMAARDERSRERRTLRREPVVEIRRTGPAENSFPTK